MTDRFITIKDAERRTGYCRFWLYRLIKDGTLPAVQRVPNGPYRIPESAIDLFCRTGKFREDG